MSRCKLYNYSPELLRAMSEVVFRGHWDEREYADIFESYLWRVSCGFKAELDWSQVPADMRTALKVFLKETATSEALDLLLEIP